MTEDIRKLQKENVGVEIQSKIVFGGKLIRKRWKNTK